VLEKIRDEIRLQVERARNELPMPAVLCSGERL
jgi:hypothetical protein